MAGPRTVLGDAIGLGINFLFARSTAPAQTMIALTDGNDTASSVPPAEAARIAHDKGIAIHTVAIGSPTAAGEKKLDEAALKDVAGATGGGFYRALDRAELEGINARLDQVETRKVGIVTYQPRSALYWMPLLAMIALARCCRRR